MSYDLLLLRHEPGQSWDEVLEANERRVLEEGDRPLSPAARTRLERIADRLQPTTRGWSAAPPSNTSSWTGRTTLASSGSLAAAWIGPTTSTRSPVATPRCPPGCPECSRTRLRNVVTDPVCGPRRPARRGTRDRRRGLSAAGLRRHRLEEVDTRGAPHYRAVHQGRRATRAREGPGVRSPGGR